MEKKIQGVLKLLIAFGILFIVFKKAGAQDILSHLKRMDIWDVLTALLVATLANLITSLRIRHFLACRGYHASIVYAIRVYYLGGVFNNILPSGIGGDVVKGHLIKRDSGFSLAEVVKLLICDRANGLYMLLVIALLTFAYITYPEYSLLTYASIALLPISGLAYLYIAKRFLGQPYQDGLGALKYSAGAQFCWAILIGVLWKGSGGEEYMLAYIFLHATANIMNTLPISFGGLGLREGVFFVGANWLNHHLGEHIDPDRGVAISLAFFAVYFVSTLPGLIWMHELPKRHKKQP